MYCVVEEVLLHWSILANNAMTLKYLLLKRHAYMITLNGGVY